MQQMNDRDFQMEPFLKWAGGKRWLIKKKTQIVPPTYERYVEPFLGGAAVFFSLSSPSYIISDLNPELINCYEAIKSNHKAVERYLRVHQRKHCDEYYYKVREAKPRTSFTRAARFLYLNRTCFNGLYRVNLQGEFNVPKGTKDKVISDADDFERIAERLSFGSIVCQDFEETLAVCGQGDFIFVDPPYTVNHNMNGFLKYNEKIFCWADQVRLKNAITSAVDRGAMVTMTNADHESIRELYEGMGQLERVSRSSVIAGRSSNRGTTSEILMRIGWRVDV